MTLQLLTALALAAGLAACTQSASTSSGAAPAPTGPPRVVSTVPALNSTVPASTDTVSVTFDRPMSEGWSFVRNPTANFPELVGNPSLSADRLTVTTHVRLQPNSPYTIQLNSDAFHNFRDPSGTPATPYTLTFRTGS